MTYHILAGTPAPDLICLPSPLMAVGFVVVAVFALLFRELMR